MMTSRASQELLYGEKLELLNHAAANFKRS